ncbi:MAG: hypothetical protein GVY27_11735 [Deinococcus-Thermus bacterium]|jgi:hypothetical protein|nr:hypothetical protein [Deinococcota bacterium]
MKAVWIVLLAIAATSLSVLLALTAHPRPVGRHVPYVAGILGVALLLSVAVLVLLR